LAIQFALSIEEIKLARRARWLARKLRGNKRFPATNEANKEGQASSQGKIGRRFTMNRWMKRRIERSRARCERVESEKGHAVKADSFPRISKPNRPTLNLSLNEAHKQAA